MEIVQVGSLAVNSVNALVAMMETSRVEHRAAMMEDLLAVRSAGRKAATTVVLERQ